MIQIIQSNMLYKIHSHSSRNLECNVLLKNISTCSQEESLTLQFMDDCFINWTKAK